MLENARREPDRPADTGEESRGVMRPLLQQPENQHSHRITNFYIDNILRPDFGRLRKDGTLVGEGDLKEGLTGRKACKTANLQHGGAEGDEDMVESDGRHPNTEARFGLMRPRGGGRRGPQTTSASAAKTMLWPAWVYCTRYSDRPSSGPRSRKAKKAPIPGQEDKRPRTAFTEEQLQRLKADFQGNRYLTEQRRQCLAHQLGLSESQIKIWFQNKRAKIKKSSGNQNPLALHLTAQGLYNHSTASGPTGQRARDGRSDSD